MRFLFVDRILKLSPGQYSLGIKQVTRDDFYLGEDERGRLCFLPSLVGEALGQLAAWNVMFANDFSHRPVAGVTSRAQLIRPVYVGETLFLESFIDAVDETAVQYHSVARVADEVVFTIDGALGPLLPMASFIDPELARSQFSEIYRPDEHFQLSDVKSPLDAINITQASASFRVAPMLFDHVISHESGRALVAEKQITRAAPYFPDHFPQKPVLPLTVLLECILNLARVFVKEAALSVSYEICEVRKIKMNEFVFPGEVVTCALQLKHQDTNELVLTARNEVNHKRVCVLEIVMRPKVSE